MYSHHVRYNAGANHDCRALGIITTWFFCCASAQAGDSLTVTVESGRAGAIAARTGAAAALDAKRGRVLVFGGVDEEKETRPTALLALNPNTGEWSSVKVAGPEPTGAFHPSIAYDSKEDALYLFGGWAKGAAAPTAELWRLSFQDDLPNWRKVAQEGETPRGRNGACMTLDARRNRLVLFGGDAGPHPRFGFTPLNDLWAFDLAKQRWERLQSTGNVPEPRWNMAAAVASEWNIMFVFGGAGYVGGKMALDQAVHSLDLETLRWTKRPAKGSPPPPVEGASLTYDPRAEALVVVGGLSLAEVGDAGPDSLWTFDLVAETWTEHARQPNLLRRDHVSVYDPATSRHVIYGGERPSKRSDFYEKGTVLDDTLLVTLRRQP